MAAPVHDVEAISGQGYVRYLHKGSTGKFRTNEIRAGGKSPQPELFAGFPHYSARGTPLSIRVRCLAVQPDAAPTDQLNDAGSHGGLV